MSIDSSSRRDALGWAVASLAAIASPTLALAQAAEGRDASFNSGGARIAAELFPASGAANGPGVVLLHGADGLRNPERYRLPARLLASQGFHALVVSYFDRTGGRGSWGEIRGREPAWRETIGDALTSLGARPEVNERRMGIVGFSLGGRLGLAVSAEDRRVRALVNFFGPLPDGFEASLRRLPPTLVMHGTADPIVPVTQSERLLELLRARNLPHRARLFEGQGHGFTGTAQAEAGLLTLQFLRENLARA